MKNELTYKEKDGILYPDVELPKQKNVRIGKYGDLHRNYLKEHKRLTYTVLLLSGTLNDYLRNVDEQARNTVCTLIEEYAAERGINEELKAADALLWAKEMNACKAVAEEFVLREMIYQ